MNATEITRQMVKGQENLDRMRHEIYATVRTLLGIVSPRDLSGIFVGDLRFQSSQDCSWRLAVTDTPDPEVFVDGRADGYGIRSSFRIYKNNAEGLGLSQVETVYDDLSTFVAGMLGLFPFLEQMIEPLLKASKKEF